MTMTKEEYAEYRKSWQWQMKRNFIWVRAKGQCERCKKQPMQDVHHITYIHVGDEHLDELLGVCRECHEDLHEIDKIEKDWTEERKVELSWEPDGAADDT